MRGLRGLAVACCLFPNDRKWGVMLSVVATLYRTAPYLEEFYARVCAAAEKVCSEYEIVLVDDGSPDESLAMAVGLCERDSRLKVVELSRNFGHHKAMLTGLAHACGDLVFLIDSDLEEEPEWLLDFAALLEERDLDVVYGVQKVRKGNLIERVRGNLFFKVFNHISEFEIPENLVTCRLMRRDYVDALLRHRDKAVCISGLWAMTGFRQQAVEVKKGCRKGTSYSFVKRVSVLVDALTSFSAVPLVWIFYLGLFILVASSMAGAWVMLLRIFQGAAPGWASLIISVWFLGGLVLFCLGIVGIYLAKVFVETKDRPLTVVRRVHEGKARHAVRSSEAENA